MSTINNNSTEHSNHHACSSSAGEAPVGQGAEENKHQGNNMFHNKSMWENKVSHMEKSKIFLDFFATDLINRSMELYFNKQQQQSATTSEKVRQTVKILDVATGTGLIPFKFVDEKVLDSDRWDISLDGIDFAETMIEGCQYKKQSRMEKNEISFDWSKLSFHVMDGQDLKYPDESFDVILANMGVLFYPDIVKGLSEIKRVLKKGGMAFLNAWTKDFPNKVPYHATFAVLGGLKDNRNTPPVFSLENPQVFEQYCTQVGFSKIQITQITQNLTTTYEEQQDIFKVGAQMTESIKKYLRENPQITETEQELLARREEIIMKEFNISSDKDEMLVVSTANVAILNK